MNGCRAIVFCSLLLMAACRKEQIPLLVDEVPSGTIFNLHDLFFVDDSVAFACGGERYTAGVLLRSTDGGASWCCTDTLFPKCAYSIFFHHASSGWISGFDGFTARTTDSAKTFSVQNTAAYLPLNEVVFSSETNGVMAGGNGYETGVLHHTTDGGITWSELSFNCNFRCVEFADAKHAVAGGYGYIYCSADSGQSWTASDARGDFFTDIELLNLHTAVAVGYQGKIMRSEDKGKSWYTVKSGNHPFEGREHFEAVKFFDETNGFAVGDEGLMYGSTDGGVTWQRCTQFTDVHLRDLHLYDARSGIACGDGGKIFRFRIQ